MTIDTALRLTEMLLAFAFLLQSTEHFVGPAEERLLFGAKAGLSIALLFGFMTPVTLLALCVVGIGALHRFQGPYNGGSDRMGLLILWCLTMAHWIPSAVWQERIIAYLAAQLILSYFISGRVKLVNPEWRSGQSLRDVFAFSAYPVSTNLRLLADRPLVMWWASWAVISFEVAFPLAMLSKPALIAALGLAAGFHLANACLFGLNRFFWTWLAAYPSILWLQDRLIGGVW